MRQQLKDIKGWLRATLALLSLSSVAIAASPKMERIIIVGSGGSGKTTLGRHLSKTLDIPCTDIDDFYWLPNWERRPLDELTSLVEQSVSSDQWIIVGNYSKFRHITWANADTIIWLDLPLPLLTWRVIKRGILQGIRGETLCNGNKQTVAQLWWMVKHTTRSYREKRKRYLSSIEETPHLQWIHLKSRKEINAFYRSHP